MYIYKSDDTCIHIHIYVPVYIYIYIPGQPVTVGIEPVTYIRIYVYYTHIYVSTFLCIYMNMYDDICIHIHVYVSIHAYVYVPGQPVTLGT